MKLFSRWGDFRAFVSRASLWAVYTLIRARNLKKKIIKFFFFCPSGLLSLSLSAYVLLLSIGEGIQLLPGGELYQIWIVSVVSCSRFSLLQTCALGRLESLIAALKLVFHCYDYLLLFRAIYTCIYIYTPVYKLALAANEFFHSRLGFLSFWFCFFCFFLKVAEGKETDVTTVE